MEAWIEGYAARLIAAGVAPGQALKLAGEAWLLQPAWLRSAVALPPPARPAYEVVECTN